MSKDVIWQKIKTQLEAVEDIIDKCSEWERDEFVPSISDQFTRNGTLSVKQQEVLEKIYRRFY
jgi:hypothetical protein